MTQPKRETRRLVPTTAACIVALLVLPLPGIASATPLTPSSSTDHSVSLHLDPTSARRVLAIDEGASQEADPEKPKAMSDQAVPKMGVQSKPATPDKLAFLKDWPFWVIVGGVVVAGVATYMLVKNANEGTTCNVGRYTLGCRGAN